MKRLRKDKPTPFELRLADQQLILDRTFVGGPLASRLSVGEVIGESKVRVFISPDDLDEILGLIAAEANHTEDRRLRKELDAAYDRLQAIEQTLDVYEAE